MAKCHGMRIEKYVSEGAGDEAYDMVPCSSERYILFFSDKGCKWTITLENVIGWCGSGYTTDVNGYLSLERVWNGYGPATHLPKDGKAIDVPGVELENKNGELRLVMEDEDVCNVFRLEDQGDEYYPNNWYTVNMGLFKEIPRCMKSRPVWIFYGEEGAGKSTIGHYLRGAYTVYETDSAANGILPAEIWADVVIVGNKWQNAFTMKDVLSRIPEDAEIISVCFSTD